VAERTFAASSVRLAAMAIQERKHAGPFGINI